MTNEFSSELLRSYCPLNKICPENFIENCPRRVKLQFWEDSDSALFPINPRKVFSFLLRGGQQHNINQKLQKIPNEGLEDLPGLQRVFHSLSLDWILVLKENHQKRRIDLQLPQIPCPQPILKDLHHHQTLFSINLPLYWSSVIAPWFHLGGLWAPQHRRKICPSRLSNLYYNKNYHQKIWTIFCHHECV